MRRSVKIGVDMPPKRLARALNAAVSEGKTLTDWLGDQVDKAIAGRLKLKGGR